MENNKSEVKGTGIILSIGFLFAIVAICFFIFKIPDFWPQVLAIIASAFLGAGATAWITNTLLNNKQKAEEEKERNLNLHKTKLKVYSDYVAEMYKALGDNHVTSDELKDLRIKLFSTVGFYAEGNVLEDIYLKIKDVFSNKNKDKQEYEKIDDKMSLLFSGITRILQNDTKSKGNPNDVKKDIKNDTIVKEEPEDDNKKKDIVQVLWNKFQEIIKVIEEQEEQDRDDRKKEEQKEKIYEKEKQSGHDKQNKRLNDSTENSNQEIKQDSSVEDEPQYLEKQAWHFNAWDNEQFDQFKEPFDKLKEKEIELSLVEYGEYWRTNLLKQVKGGDIIMLFRRGGYGYVGAFKAIGRRIFDFEKGEEEILYFEDPENNIPEKRDIVTNIDNFDKDARNYDIYGVREDNGVTLCSNLIVKCLAYVPEGVGNPGGVYRRTISRYDSHYAWLLMKRFQE